MTKVWIVLGLTAVVVFLAAATKSWWYPEGLRDQWHQAWITYPAEETPKAALLAGHERRMAALETEFREKIEKEKTANTSLLAERASLTDLKPTP